ncbi:MAG TPA: PilZ domain-containing protein [Patescibacteria group bacterium]|nr:PilZ domain-containing protein [Patescibacteria group bacterium]
MLGTQTQATYRRCHDRYLVDAAATLFFDTAGERPSRLMDVSWKGAGVYTDYPLTQNDTVQIFIPPSYFFDTPVRHHARVAWCNKIRENLWRAGLVFEV